MRGLEALGRVDQEVTALGIPVVRDAAVGLWLPAAEHAQHETLFSQAGTVEQVHRICLAVYDRSTGLCNTMQRFVAAADCERVRALLVERIPAATKSAGDLAMEVETGSAVIRTDAADLADLGRQLDSSC